MEGPEDTGDERPPLDPAEVDRGFRKLYVSFGLKALAGALIIAVLFFIQLPSKWIALPFMLVGGWLLFVNLSSISVLVSAQARYKGGPEDRTPFAAQDRGEEILHYTGFVLLFVTMFAIIPLGRVVENIVDEKRYLLQFGSIGVVLASFILWLVKQRLPYFYRNNERRAAAVLGLFLGIVGLCILVPGRVDRESARSRAEVRRYALEKAGENISSGAKYLHVLHPEQNGATFRLRVRTPEFNRVQGKDSVDLRVGMGDLGFTHVLEVAE